MSTKSSLMYDPYTDIHIYKQDICPHFHIQCGDAIIVIDDEKMHEELSKAWKKKFSRALPYLKRDDDKKSLKKKRSEKKNE